MKKLYVKPVALNVAFVVNENIAISREPDESLTGKGSYANVEAGICNEYFNSTTIKTYLEPGEYDIQKAFSNVQKYDPANLQVILNILTGGSFNCF